MTKVFNRPILTYRNILDNGNQPCRDNWTKARIRKRHKLYTANRGRPTDPGRRAQYDAVVAFNIKHGIKKVFTEQERRVRSVFVSASHRVSRKKVTLPRLTCLEDET